MPTVPPETTGRGAQARAARGLRRCAGKEPLAGQPRADESESGQADQRIPLVSAGSWTSGSAPEETLRRGLRPLERARYESSAPPSKMPARCSGSRRRRAGSRSRLCETGGQRSSGLTTLERVETDDRERYVQDTADLAAGRSGCKRATGRAASLIGTTEPADQSARPWRWPSRRRRSFRPTWNETTATCRRRRPQLRSRVGAGGSQRISAYAYDPAYGWLRGRLEYSASQRQWKLRYIPIDGTTDQFGGSVVLADGTPTQGLRAGDFVTAQGHVIGASQPGRGFSPRYEVASIQASRPGLAPTLTASSSLRFDLACERRWPCALRVGGTFHTFCGGSSVPRSRPIGVTPRAIRLFVPTRTRHLGGLRSKALCGSAVALPLAFFRANVL